MSEDDVLEDDTLESAADNDSDDDAVEGDEDYRKLVYFCSPRWKKSYKKRPEDDQLDPVEPAKKVRIVLADYLNPPIDYVVGTASRWLGDTMAKLLLVKCGVSLYWKKDEDVERPLSAEYEACIARCHDMDFIEIRLRAEYGDAAFAKHFPCRYLEYDWDAPEHKTAAEEKAGTEDAFRAVNKRQFYVDKLRSIENRWNASCARANLPPLYIEDWTDEERADGTLELLEFINYLANSSAVARFLPQFRQLENMRCKATCGSCGAPCEEEAVPHCCAKRSSVNIDKRTKQFSWCEEGERGDRPPFMYFECTPECACGDECDNRAVQDGRQVPLCVFREPGRGWGVRTVCPLDDGAYVTEYCGEVNVGGLEDNDKARYDFGMRHRVRDPKTGDVLHKHLVISAADKGNEARFFNHSCSPNMHSECTVIERYGIFYHHVSFWTIRRILAGEELKFDYFPHRRRACSETRKMFESCRCGAVNCRFLASSSSSGKKDHHGPKRRRAEDVVALSSDDDEEEDGRREKRVKVSQSDKLAGPPIALTARKAPPSCSSSDSEEDMEDDDEGSQDVETRVLTACKAPPSCSSSDSEENMMEDEEDEDCPVPVTREDDLGGLDGMLDGDMLNEEEEDGVEAMLKGKLMDGDMMDLYLPEDQESSPRDHRIAGKRKCPSSYRYESESEQEEVCSPPWSARNDDYGRLMVVLPLRAAEEERQAVVESAGASVDAGNDNEEEAVDRRENEEEGVERPLDTDDDDPTHTAAPEVPRSNGDDVEDAALLSRPTSPERPTIEGLLGTPDAATPIRKCALTTPSRPMTGEELGTPARARSGRPIATTPTARSPMGREYERSPASPPARSFDREGGGGRREPALRRD